MSKERSIEIVNASGTVVMSMDGDRGVRGPAGTVYHDEVIVEWPLLAASVDTYIWTARSGIWQVVGATSIISVSGGTGASVMPMVCSGVTAVASGVAQLAAALDLEETAPSRQVGTMVAAPGYLYPGDSLALDFSGTLTALVGCISIYLRRVD